MTTRSETADTRLSLPDLASLRHSDWGRGAFAFSLTLIAAAVLVLAFVVGLARAFDGRLMAGVTVHGVSVAGLTPAEAEARLRGSLAPLDEGTATLALDGDPTSITYSSIGRDYDLAAMLDAGMVIGHSGSPLDRTLDQLRSLLNGSSVLPAVRYDRAALERQVTAAVDAFATPPVDATAALASDGERFTVTASRDGRRVKPEVAMAALSQALDAPSPQDVTIELAGVATEPAVTTAEADAAVARAEMMTRQPLQLRAEDKTFTVPVETLRAWILFTPRADGGYSGDPISTRVAGSLEAFASSVGRPAQNATFKVSGGEVVDVVPAVDGLQLDARGSAGAVLEALAARADGEAPASVELSIVASEPGVTTAEARAASSQMERLSTWTTYYPVGEKNFWGKNITIPTATIDGYVLAPGETFDFWAAIGDVSRANGYGPGGAIINGRTEPTGALAGGICSCSTTLFNAAARAGLKMGDRRNHYYYISRYPVGLDATVFKSSSGTVQSMSFTNDTAGPVLIRGINEYGAVTFQVYGIDDGRTVGFSSASVSNYQVAKDSVEYTSALAPGVRRRVEVPVNGFSANVVRTVRAADGTILHQDSWFSRYAVITGVVEVGKARAPAGGSRNNDDGGTGGDG